MGLEGEITKNADRSRCSAGFADPRGVFARFKPGKAAEAEEHFCRQPLSRNPQPPEEEPPPEDEFAGSGKRRRAARDRWEREGKTGEGGGREFQGNPGGKEAKISKFQGTPATTVQIPRKNFLYYYYAMLIALISLGGRSGSALPADQNVYKSVNNLSISIY
jgi:hypothetical protein